MIFWNLSTLTLLILALIELLTVLWCQKHRLSHRKFLSAGNTWKTMAIRVFKIKPKSCMVAIATYMTAEWWNWTFRNGKFIEKSPKAKTPNRSEDMLWFGDGGTMRPPWPGYLEGSTIFLCCSSLSSTAMESCRLVELKYVVFSRTGHKN